MQGQHEYGTPKKRIHQQLLYSSQTFLTGFSSPDDIETGLEAF